MTLAIVVFVVGLCYGFGAPLVAMVSPFASRAALTSPPRRGPTAWIMHRRIIHRMMVGLAAVTMATFSACAAPRGRRGDDDRNAERARRSAACRLALYHTAAPPLAPGSWDDIGVAEVICHIDVGFPVCLQRFRAEACRMGGDIVYAVADEPLRPREQTVMYRGRVARLRPGQPLPPPAVVTSAVLPDAGTADTPARDVLPGAGRAD